MATVTTPVTPAKETEKVHVFLPKLENGEEQFETVGINGVFTQIPRGKHVYVSRDVYTILARSADAKEYTEAFDKKNEEVLDDRRS